LKSIIAKKDFALNGIAYEKGDEVKVKDKSELVSLNEKGFIEPLTLKQIQNFGKEPKENKKEEE
jgi:hypothetical protein